MLEAKVGIGSQSSLDKGDFSFFSQQDLMLGLTKIEPTILFPRPTLLEDDATQSSSLGRRWDQPDIKKNPKLWLKMYLEGMSLHRRSLALASRADSILDLGCGCGWFSIALAQRRSDVSIEAIDVDGRLLDWARYYLDREAAQGKANGRVRFSEVDIDEFPWDKYEEAFDLVHAGFILSRSKKPLDALAGIYKSLKPGGWLIYHDATDPPSRNLNRMARFEHAFSKWSNDSSDPWSWRRKWKYRYRLDVVRAKARAKDPEECEVIRRLEELFAMRYHERRRAFLDLFLRRYKKSSITQTMMIPLIKFCDDSLVWTNQLVGATRYVLGQKR